MCNTMKILNFQVTEMAALGFSGRHLHGNISPSFFRRNPLLSTFFSTVIGWLLLSSNEVSAHARLLLPSWISTPHSLYKTKNMSQFVQTDCIVFYL